jgi:NADH-quinone oxidoreductase subunit J
MGPLLFNVFALLAVIAAIGTVLNKNAVNAAMCFMLSLLGVAGLFVMLEAYLLAFVLILVYAGAVAALFLFIVMLLDTHDTKPTPRRPITALASTLAAALIAVGVLTIYQHPVSAGNAAPAAPALGASFKLYAYELFTTYLLPVQIVGFLLLIAMLGVIVLSKKLDPKEAA